MRSGRNANRTSGLLALLPRILPVMALPVLLAIPTLAHSLQSPVTALYRVDCATDDVVQTLLQADVVVSRRLETTCLVFADPSVTSLLDELGCPFTLIEHDVADREHYLVQGQGAWLRSLAEPLRLLDVIADVGVVSVGEAQAGAVRALEADVARLFKTPMRLQPTAAPVAPSGRRSMQSDSFIAGLVAEVSADSLRSCVAHLEAFGSRNAGKKGGREAAQWIATLFEAYGVDDVEIHNWNPELAGNVIATLRGTETPERVFILGGHYDSIVPGSELEPGADDNATGTATVLEVARILARHSFSSTLKLIAFGAEEYGLLGSEAYAARARSAGEQIVGVLNLDMLGYLAPQDARDVDVLTDAASAWLLQEAQSAGALYVPGFSVLRRAVIFGRSDHESFWRHGFHAIYFHEDNDDSPYIHTTDDVSGLSYNDVELHAQCTRTALALMATLAGAREDVPVVLQTMAVERLQQSVHLRWRMVPSARQDLAGILVQRSIEPEGPYENRTPTALAPLTSEFVDAIESGQHASWYRLGLESHDGRLLFTAPVVAQAGKVQTGLRATYQLHHNGPVQISFGLEHHIPSLRLAIYDVRGRPVRVLLEDPLGPGHFLHAWDRRDDEGRLLARGAYFVHLRGPGVRSTRKVILQSR